MITYILIYIAAGVISGFSYLLYQHDNAQSVDDDRVMISKSLAITLFWPPIILISALGVLYMACEGLALLAKGITNKGEQDGTSTKGREA